MSNLAKKPCLEDVFQCCNSSCPKPGGFTTEKGLHINYGKSLHCGAHTAACQAYIRRNFTIHSQPSLSQPWDLADNETSAALVAIYNVPPFNNTVVEETDVAKNGPAHKTN
jgi:hypothetical protein